MLLSPVEPIDSVLPSIDIVSSVKITDDDAGEYSSTSLRRVELERSEEHTSELQSP